MTSYLSNRLQYVSLNNVNFKYKTAEMDVPQGSVIRSLLFLIYDFQNCMSSLPIYLVFADDTAVVVSANTLQNLEFLLNFELSKINTWMNKNKLTINPSKIYALVISPRLAVNTSSLNIRLNSSRIKKTDCINY